MPRTLAKTERLRLIGSLIARRRIGSQQELLNALGAEGFHVTQATVSRDIRELGLEKALDPLGRPRYVAPDAGGPDAGEVFRGILAQFGRRATAAQNIVVLHCELGSAPALARALDRSEHPRVVGTLAGDDTVLVVAANDRDARAVAQELHSLIG